METLRERSADLLCRTQRASRERAAGYWMLRCRQASGIPQAALANRLGVPIWKISRFERGLDPIPARLIARVATLLDLPEHPSFLH